MGIFKVFNQLLKTQNTKSMAGAMLFERAQAVSMTNRIEGINLLNEIVHDPNIGHDEDDEDSIRVKEQGILQLGELYKKEGKAKELADLIKATRPFLSLISKAKAAKLVRSLVDFFLDLEAGIGIEVLSCFCFGLFGGKHFSVFL